MVATLMALPYCRLVGAVLLLTIAVKLTLVRRAEKAVAARANFWQAVGTIALADAIMGVDNVLAIAAAARGSWALIVFGIALSTPLVAGGSALLVGAPGRSRVVVWAGTALQAGSRVNLPTTTSRYPHCSVWPQSLPMYGAGLSGQSQL
jgi:predicted tellurium resistance membrane protein TerC